MSTYIFRVTPTVDVEIDADSKGEARAGLNQRLAEYFGATTKRMTKRRPNSLMCCETGIAGVAENRKNLMVVVDAQTGTHGKMKSP
jgi:hypothetical protein